MNLNSCLSLGKSLGFRRIVTAGTLNRPKWAYWGLGKVSNEEETSQTMSNFLSPKCADKNSLCTGCDLRTDYSPGVFPWSEYPKE